MKRNNILLHTVKGGPVGGGYSTSKDMLKFAQVLLENKIIRGDTLDKARIAYSKIAFSCCCL